MWVVYMILGAMSLKAFQVCRLGMDEMTELDERDESWQSILDIQ